MAKSPDDAPARNSDRPRRRPARSIKSAPGVAAAVRRELAAAEARYEMARAEMLTLREEYLTSSQELQRRNEELEEAQRQLDSSNRQLIRRNQELTRLAGDLSNLLAAVDIPILMLDSDLRIRRFTGNADQVLNLTASDVGRPSAKIAAELEVPDWDRLLLAVMENFHTVEREVRDRQGRWYCLRVRPYQTVDHRIDGVVVGLFNMDTVHRRMDQERGALQARLATAREDEQRRISREVHDDLTQRLAGLAIDLGQLAAAAPPAKEKAQFQSLQKRVIEAAEAARHIAHELHPSELDDLGLVAAIRAYCQEFSRREAVEIRFTSAALPDGVAGEVLSCLYKITQEALRNIARHAHARRAGVRLEGTAGGISLEVADDGVGFPVQVLTGSVGLGIQSMKERVRLLNGRFSIESSPGGGTTVRVELPSHVRVPPMDIGL